MKITNICVFCASSSQVSDLHFDTAKYLGEKIAKANYTLVYGGANIGLMGTLANSTLEHGGKVTGVIPQVIFDRALGHETIDNLIVTKDMYERKAQMSELADAFITLPGGFGTLEEVFEVITAKQLGIHSKPIIFVNSGNFYQKLIEHIEIMYAEKFAKSEYRHFYHVAEDVDDAMDYLLNYQPTEYQAKW